MKRITIKNLIALTLLFVSTSVIAQAESLFNDISLGDTTKDVKAKLDAISETTKLISIDELRFPLATNSETHLVCNNIKTKNGVINKAVFSFADDKLSYIEAKGNAVEVFESIRKDTARTYLDYSAYVKD